jgi:hypothetical protein
MTRLRQRLKKLEARRPEDDGVIFISTGVPRGDKVGDLDVAITPQGWVTKTPYETDAQFRDRVTGGTPCGR